MSGGIFNNAVTIGSDKNLTQTDTGWDDEARTLVGIYLNVASARMSYNFDELGIDFADNARYANTASR
jgi:hypothetical protein